MATDPRVTEALAALAMNGGNVKRTATELGMNRTTLIKWRDNAEKATTAAAAPPAGVRVSPSVTSDSDTENKTARREHFREKWARLAEAAVDRLIELVPTTGARDLITLAGVAADKEQDYGDGRRGAQATTTIEAGAEVTADGIVRALIRVRQEEGA